MLKKNNKTKVPNDVKLLTAYWEKHRQGIAHSKSDTAMFIASNFEMFNYCTMGVYLIFFDRMFWRSKLRKD